MRSDLRGPFPPAVSCREVTRTYTAAGSTVLALDSIDARFERGHVTAIAGPSGSGKSTLLRILAALDRPTSGEVAIEGRLLSGLGAGARRRLRRLEIGYLFQDPAANLLPYLTVADHLELSARLRGLDPAAEVPPLVEQLDLARRIDRVPAQLSGGEQQLVAFAAAVVGRPAVVIADEPTAELDNRSAALVVDALGTMRDVGAALVVATHDTDVLAIADRVLVLRHGAIEGVS